MITKRVVLKLEEPTKETGRIYPKSIIRSLIRDYMDGENQMVSLYNKNDTSYYVNFNLIYGKVLSLKIVKNNLVARIKIYEEKVNGGVYMCNLLKNGVKVKFHPAFVCETETLTRKVKYSKLINIIPMSIDGKFF